MTREENIKIMRKIRDINNAVSKLSGKGIDETILVNALEIIDAVVIQPVIYPSFDYSIIFEYAKKNGHWMTIELSKNDNHFTYTIADDDEVRAIFFDDFKFVIQCLNAYYINDDVLSEQHYD